MMDASYGMRTVLLLFALMMGLALGDGIRMTKDYRFVFKPESCYTIKLTADQIAGLEAQRKGDTKLYAKMKLTREQKAFLREKTAKQVTEVLVFEKGWIDCSCCAHNIASRFKPDRIEVSDTYLEDDSVARKREARMKAVDEQQAKEAAEKAKAAAEKGE